MFMSKQILEYAIDGINLKIEQCEEKILKAKNYLINEDNASIIKKLSDVININERRIEQLMKEKYEIECYLS